MWQRLVQRMAGARHQPKRRFLDVGVYLSRPDAADDCCKNDVRFGRSNRISEASRSELWSYGNPPRERISRRLLRKKTMQRARPSPGAAECEVSDRRRKPSVEGRLVGRNTVGNQAQLGLTRRAAQLDALEVAPSRGQCGPIARTSSSHRAGVARVAACSATYR